MKHQNILLSWLLWMISVATNVACASEEALVQQMQAGGAVLMIRHALAPGIGDPEGFRLDDCSTQRNLNEEGRQQAGAIGEWLRSRGIHNARIYSSQWCRCLETARLMKMGDVIPLPALNSFFERPQDQQRNLSAIKAFVSGHAGSHELLIMVTHQVTISGITGQWTDSGQGKLVRPTQDGGMELLGSLNFGTE